MRINWLKTNLRLNHERAEQLLQRNWDAFCANYEPIYIRWVSKQNGLYLYHNPQDEQDDRMCKDGITNRSFAHLWSIDELNGWLWGMAQAANKVVKRKEG